MNKKIITKHENETFSLAVNMTKYFVGGEVIALIGDLGAGKTIFSKGIAKGLRYKENVASPTFVLMNIYPINCKNIKSICHIDAYRLESEEDLNNIGANDYIGQNDTVTIIEWADRVINFLPSDTIFITIKIKEDGREFYINNLPFSFDGIR